MTTSNSDCCKGRSIASRSIADLVACVPLVVRRRRIARHGVHLGCQSIAVFASKDEKSQTRLSVNAPVCQDCRDSESHH